MAPRPKVLLLDEPLSALDLKLRQAMRIELKQIQEETGITFVFVTHDQEEALTMSDRIAVMSEGEIRQVGHAARHLRGARRPLRGGFHRGDQRARRDRFTRVPDDAAAHCRSAQRFAAFPVPGCRQRRREDGAAAHVLIRPERLSLMAERGLRPAA